MGMEGGPDERSYLVREALGKGRGAVLQQRELSVAQF